MKKSIHTTSSSKVMEVPAILIGAAVAVVISILLTAGLTSLIMNEAVAETAVGPYIFIVRTAAATIGCLIGMVLFKGKYLFVAGIVALSYLAVLIGIGIILYDGSFSNILSAAASVLLGSVIACLVVLKPLKKPKHKLRYGR